MPATLVVAVATLVRCLLAQPMTSPTERPQAYGLLRRNTLPPPDGGWKFTTNGHQNTYKKHLNSLGHLKDVNDVGLSVLLVTIYRKSRLVLSTRSQDSISQCSFSGVTEPVATEGDLVKGINPAALPRAYNSADVEE